MSVPDPSTDAPAPVEVNIPDPIEDAQGRLEAMRAGVWDGVEPAAAESGAADAIGALSDGRGFGVGLIAELPLDPKFGWLPVWVAVTDGEREGAIMATLSANRASALVGHGETPAAEVLERLRALECESGSAAFDELAVSHPVEL